MQKKMKIGLLLLMMFSSCVLPTLKKPVKMFVINTQSKNVLSGLKNFNYKSEAESVGEWISETRREKLEQIDSDLTCFSTRTWLTVIKPKIKEGSRAYHDQD